MNQRNRPKMAKNGQNTFSWIINEDEFFRKNRRVRFLPLTQWTFMQKIRKILRAVIQEIWLPTDQQTNQPTNIKGPDLN